MKRLLIIIFLGATSTLALAANPEEAPRDPDYLVHLMEYIVLGFGLAVIIGALLTLANLVNSMMRAQGRRLSGAGETDAVAEPPSVASESWWHRLYKRATKVVPVEQEEAILFDHEYDGIRELDNSLPPWWVAMFYITIIFAVAYMGYQHIWSYGLSMEEEYALEMKVAEEAKKAVLARGGAPVDETNVVLMTDELELGIGRSIYELNCSVCHGKAGEGLVGPNFADQYWIHGGRINDLFRVIKYGVPEKGMISWQSQLKPTDIQKVASYILTFQGTDPPNAKAPEGELYEPGVIGSEGLSQDSLQQEADSDF